MTIGKKIKVVADRETCFGGGQCVFWSPGVFDQGDDARVVILMEYPHEAEYENVIEAVDVCPSQCLKVLEVDG